MRRITISLEDSLAKLAEDEVASGRAASVSAWVASAIRAKALARQELLEDLANLEAGDPTPSNVIEAVARTLGLPRSTVGKAIRRRQARGKRAA